MNDVLLNKASTIEKCLARISEVYTGTPAILNDIDEQDIVILNLQRAIQACIDMATHFIRVKKWGIPQSYGENFQILVEHNVIDPAHADRLVSMVAFRNIVIHDYQRLNMDIVVSILEHNLDDIVYFKKIILKE